MTPESIMDLAHQGMRVTLLLAAPPLLTALFIGLAVSLFQAVTQINEMTLSFIPKLLVLTVVLVIAGTWMLDILIHYTERLFASIPGLIG